MHRSLCSLLSSVAFVVVVLSQFRLFYSLTVWFSAKYKSLESNTDLMQMLCWVCWTHIKRQIFINKNVAIKNYDNMLNIVFFFFVFLGFIDKN